MFELVVRGSQRNYEATRVTVDAAGGGGGWSSLEVFPNLYCRTEERPSLFPRKGKGTRGEGGGFLVGATESGGASLRLFQHLPLLREEAELAHDLSQISCWQMCKKRA